VLSLLVSVLPFDLIDCWRVLIGGIEDHLPSLLPREASGESRKDVSWG